MDIPINSKVHCENEEQLKTVILIFMSYDYLWHVKNWILPGIDINYPVTIGLTRSYLSPHNVDKGYRLVIYMDRSFNIKAEEFILKY